MQQSHYNFFIEESNKVLAINLLSQTTIILDQSNYKNVINYIKGKINKLTTKEKDILLFFLENNFFYQEEFDELAYIKYKYQQNRFDKTLLGCVITPTLECNFRCYYCFEEKQPEKLTRKAQNQILLYIATNIPKSVSLEIQWFGGEPLLSLDIIKYMSKKIQELCIDTNHPYIAKIVTNGYLLTETVSKELSKLSIKSAQIPLDGYKDTHDSIRFNDKGGSFDTIMSNIKSASKYMNISLRVHVNKKNISSIHHLIDYLHQNEYKQFISEIYFAPLFNYCTSKKKQSFEPDSESYLTSEEFSKIQSSLMKKLVDKGFKIQNPLDFSYGICTAVQNNTILFDSVGNMHKCYMDVGNSSEIIGKLEEGPYLNNKLMQWLDYEFWQDVECKKCKFLPLCLGGCPKQNITKADKSVICTPLKYNYSDIFKLKFLD